MLNVQSIEANRLREQGRLDLLKTTEERNRWGQFATPPALALSILNYAWQLLKRGNESIRFLDPALGTGAFYSALRQSVPQNRLKAAAGIELDPLFARSAAALWGSTGLEVLQADFTTLVPPAEGARYNLVVSNPPYVRHHHLHMTAKERLKNTIALQLGMSISGLAGLYSYFLLLGDAWLADHGFAIWLIPSEFMDVNYGDAVRRYLTERVTLLRIHRFCPSDVQFSDALVSSAVVAFRKTPPEANHEAEFSLGGPLARPDKTANVPLNILRTTTKWTKYPQGEVVPCARQVGSTLGDLFSIKRGLATGSNSFFILSEDEARGHGIPRKCLRPILPSPRLVQGDVIEADPDGYPRIEPRLALIDCELCEEDVQKRYPRFWEYLARGKGQGIHKSYLTSRRSPWYSQEKRPAAPFLCTYMGRAQNGRKPFRFLWNKSQATAHNVYLLLYPRKALENALKAEPNLYEAVFRELQDIDTQTLIGEGRVYGGGLHKMEPNELGRISAEPLLEILKGVALPRQPHLFA